MKCAMPGYLFGIARAIARAGYPCYAVGGSVRGCVMGLPAADYDLCGPATVQQIVDALEDDGEIAYSRVYGKMGTMRLTAPGGYAEYTTFRSERYDGGHVPSEVVFVDSLERDAYRRDFTCNALYMDLPTGEIADPTGGLADIKKRVLRATSADPMEIMRDDGLRVLRMVRFAAQLRFAVDPDTYACADASLLRDIAPERLMDELTQILLADARYDLPGGREALALALSQLTDIGAFDILFGDCEPDVAACTDAPPELELRLAALLGRNAPDRVAEVLGALRYPVAVRREAACLVRDVQTGEQDEASLLHKGFAHAEKIVALRPQLRPLFDRLAEQNAPGSPGALAVRGDEAARALGGPSERVGRALTMLWRFALRHPQCNNEGDLLRELDRLIEEEIV